ncbi:uncharacterized protein N7479_010981 [Penicillium vulpinum]|uniref:uncharacterized protein n=1 Tax=Penicillium vulpinum TaxID=29845 RepID=UPI0025493D6E|nr:uncharacterized protein N7479_010981 [Penicillium vulpinum]KAJ5952568.1 hypothetical protein N7479_010981 [Penicillium vulpinum]
MDTPGSLAGIEYALDVLGADGGTLFTRYGDENNYLGYSARKTLVFFHPTHSVNTTSTNPLLSQPVIDYSHKTARTAVDLSFCNVTQKFLNWPKNSLACRGLASIPNISASRATSSTKITFGKTNEEIIDDFRPFYYDVALSSSSSILNMIRDLVPHAHITYGLLPVYISLDLARLLTFFQGSDFTYAGSNKITGFREDLDAFAI